MKLDQDIKVRESSQLLSSRLVVTATHEAEPKGSEIHCQPGKLSKALTQNKKYKWGVGGTGEMAQWLRALTALPEILSSNSSNLMVAHSHL